MPVLFRVVSSIGFSGVILNSHGVEVSLVNNDVSTSFVYTWCCCVVSASELSCCDMWLYVCVHCGLVSGMLLLLLLLCV